MTNLSDDDIREIARLGLRYISVKIGKENYCVLDGAFNGETVFTADTRREADDRALLLNGRSMIAEYLRRTSRPNWTSIVNGLSGPTAKPLALIP